MIDRAPVLTGCAIVVAGVRHSAPLTRALERRGAQVHRVPRTGSTTSSDTSELLARTRELMADAPDVIVVSSGAGFRNWMRVAQANDLSAPLTEMCAGAILVAWGSRADRALRHAGFASDLVVDAEDPAAIGAYIRARWPSETRVVILHQGTRTDDLDALLGARGAAVVTVPVVRWGEPADPHIVRRSVMRASAGETDAVLFTSVSGADEWIRAAESARVLDTVRRRAASGSLLLVAGPTPSSLLRGSDLRTRVAAPGRVGAFVQEVVDHFASGERPIVRTASGAVEIRSGGALIDGRFVPLARTSASILGALVDAGGHVLSREELVRALPRRGESVHAAEMAVARLREALGTPEIVKTVVKRGYRLNVDDPD